MPFLTHEGRRLHYVERGSGPPIVLLHGLLWSSRMFVRLRRMLDGYRVVLPDLRGHGLSDRPPDESIYTWEGFASDVVAVLDHLGLDRAVVGGLSLGANVTIATAMRAPERCAGIVVEMPVLAHGRDFAYRVFGPLASAFERGAPLWRRIGRLSARIPLPRAVPELAAVRDVAAVDPDPAAAVLRGLLARGVVVEDLTELAGLKMPALVIGHRRDPLHVLDDAKELADALPRGRFVTASSILEYRLRPDRLAVQLQEFLDEVWATGAS